jgi:hypothetical protein
MSLEDINNAIRGSQEGQSYQTDRTINSFYQGALGRDAEQTGMESWRNALQGGSSMDDIRNAIYGSQEAQNYRDIPADIRTPYIVKQGPGNPPEYRDPSYPGNPPEYRDPSDPGRAVESGGPFNYGISQQPILDGRAVESGGPFNYGTYGTAQQPILDGRAVESGGPFNYGTSPQQMDPVMDFVQNIDQQLPYLQRAFQEQLQLVGDPVAAARAVLGSLR